MAPQFLQDILDRIQSYTDWVLRSFLAVILRCLGVLLQAVFRPADDGNTTRLDEDGEPMKRAGQIIQERMSGATGQQQHRQHQREKKKHA